MHWSLLAATFTATYHSIFTSLGIQSRNSITMHRTLIFHFLRPQSRLGLSGRASSGKFRHLTEPVHVSDADLTQCSLQLLFSFISPTYCAPTQEARRPSAAQVNPPSQGASCLTGDSEFAISGRHLSNSWLSMQSARAPLDGTPSRLHADLPMPCFGTRDAVSTAFAGPKSFPVTPEYVDKRMNFDEGTVSNVS